MLLSVRHELPPRSSLQVVSSLRSRSTISAIDGAAAAPSLLLLLVMLLLLTVLKPGVVSRGVLIPSCSAAAKFARVSTSIAHSFALVVRNLKVSTTRTIRSSMGSVPLMEQRVKSLANDATRVTPPVLGSVVRKPYRQIVKRRGAVDRPIAAAMMRSTDATTLPVALRRQPRAME